jgi:hypothetical protein
MKDLSMTVVKRTKQASASELLQALGEFIDLLEDQGETEAVIDLKRFVKAIESHPAGSPAFLEGINGVMDAFGDEHELAAYTMTPKEASADQWTAKERLFLSSTRVFSLVKRFVK